MHLFAFLFLSPLTAFAVAAGAVSIPIIIHLLNRKRFRVVTWAAMRFLLAAQKQNVRRMRLEQIILLATRVLLLLLLVLALASGMEWADRLWSATLPSALVSTNARKGGGQRTHKILVIDGSFSMALKIGDTTCFDRARARAEQIVRDAANGDGFTVVLMAAPPRRIVPEPSEDGQKVAAEIQALRLPHGNADLGATLNTVEDLLRQSPGKFREKEVYFLTDLQHSTWVTGHTSGPGARPAGSMAATIQKIQEHRARTIFVDVGEEGSENLAVTNLTIDAPLATTGTIIPITATIHNYGPEREQARVELWVGRARISANDAPFQLRVASQPPPIKLSRGPNTVSFPYKFTVAGEYVVQVRVENDALELDDLRSAVITVKNTVPVLLVNGKPAANELDQATGLLHLALNPFDAGVIPGNIPARPKVIDEAQFARADQGDLTNFDCVFLCDLTQLSEAQVRRLETHLRRGGGVVFCLGDKINLRAYNELLYADGKGLLPAKLIGVQPAAADHFFRFIVDAKNYLLPPLEAFGGANDRASLLATRFRQYVRTQLAPAGQPRKVLAFMPERARLPGPDGRKEDADSRLPIDEPALIEWNPPIPRDARLNVEAGGDPRYRGRVVLFTSTLNMDWTSWPASPSYVPFVQELLRFAVAGRVREQAGVVGDTLEVYLQTSRTGVEAAVHSPDGRTETTPSAAYNDVSMMRWADTDVSGVYRVTVGQDAHEHLFAVNVPTATEAQQACESELRRTNATELQATYPDWDFQLVTDPSQVVAPPTAAAATPELRWPGGKGKLMARVLLTLFLALLLGEVVLAWHFGHFSAVVGTPGVQAATGRPFPVLAAVFSGLVFLALWGVLLHAAWTKDFLGFLGDNFRRDLETGALFPERWRPLFALALDLPPTAPGESIRWRLEAAPGTPPFLTDPWIVGSFALTAAVLICLVHRREGHTASPPYKLLLTYLRVNMVLLTVIVFLPQLQVRIERQKWPGIVILIDDSQSMSHVDRYQDADVQKAADALAQSASLTAPERLQLAQALLTRPDADWLTELLTKRKVKVHVYHCSSRATRIAHIAQPEELEPARQGIKALRADAKNDSSQLGAAVRQVLNDFRGSSLAALVMLTDGVTTEGEDLAKVARYAALRDVPLFFVGIGDAHEARDLILHDLQVEESVFVNDRVVFEARLTGKGYPNRRVKIRLKEKGQNKVLDEKEFEVDGLGKPVRVRLVHQPTEPGEKVYVLEAEPAADEAQKDNNTLERSVHVHKAKLFKVLYVEGYRRYEYHYIKTLLERESARTEGNKSIDLKVLLADADPDWVASDKSAILDFPTKTELNQFDVIILGDVDAKHPKLGEKNLANLADFVRERGGGLLMLAGERYAPHTYKTSPLRDILPIDMTAERQPNEPPEGRPQGFRPELTPVGRLHPIFRFSPDEAKNEEIWSQFREMYWWSEGYKKKQVAEVLATYPRRRAEDGVKRPTDEGQPLVVQQFVGAGRSMFFGFNETWRWRYREQEAHFNHFWVQTVRYLGRSRLGRVDLRLDRQTPYRRGEPIRMTVRFPDDAPPPAAETEVKVFVERKPTGAVNPTDPQTITLAKVEDSRATYEGLLTRTPDGEYRFTLSAPTVTGSKPQAQCRVLAPPGEMEQLQMNRPDMERAAEQTKGKFFTLADADQLLDALPSGKRVTLNATVDPWLLWNHFALFVMAVSVLTLEWVLRKRKHLL